MLTRWVKPFVASALLALLVVVPTVQADSGRADSGLQDLTWKDLAPGGADKKDYLRRTSALASIILELRGDKPKPPKMADALDGKRIRLSGYIVPLKFDGSAVEEFLLVPYVGACVHVPPPPKNQIVLVKSDRPIKGRGLFQAVTVTGIMTVGDETTELAETGYRLAATKVIDYREYRRIKRQPGHPVTSKVP